MKKRRITIRDRPRPDISADIWVLTDILVLAKTADFISLSRC